MNNILKQDLFKIIGPEFFSAIFTKKNGEKRKMLAKLHVKDQKFFAGGELLGDRNHLLECIDVNVLKKVDDPKLAWRSIPLNLDPNVKGQGCLLSLKVNKVELVQKGESHAQAA
jgi:hypothetical protein|tara:strand:- start:1089 stop:1430 length:342 start_codon:yes stop_codon:yes gene_type:complete